MVVDHAGRIGDGMKKMIYFKDLSACGSVLLSPISKYHAELADLIQSPCHCLCLIFWRTLIWISALTLLRQCSRLVADNHLPHGDVSNEIVRLFIRLLWRNTSR